MFRLLASLGRRLGATLHRLCGTAWFRVGSVQRARRHFERVLDLRGDAFVAYVFLGRVSYAEGDYAGWRREMEHARRTDPERFARLSHPFELFVPRPAGTPFEEAGERATWRATRPSSAARRNPVRAIDLPTERGAGQESPADPLAGWDPTAGDHREGDAGQPGANQPGHQRELMRGDDCASGAERQRFAALGPIRAEQLRGIDLEALCRRLLD